MLFSPQSKKAASRINRLPRAARGVWRLNLLCVNAYLLESPDGEYILVDTGLTATTSHLQGLLPALPSAIVLTHGHCDHAGGAVRFARDWGVPVYAHPLEIPYLTGRADYLPEDLSTGGPAALFNRFFRNRGFNLTGCVRPIPEDGTLPHLPGWRWLHTPGHTPGHISLFREMDRTLITGDALLTTDVGSWVSYFMCRQEIAGPPAPSTEEWPSAVRSLHLLTGLEPLTIAAGHGRPISGPTIPVELRAFADGTDFKARITPARVFGYCLTPLAATGESALRVSTFRPNGSRVQPEVRLPVKSVQQCRSKS